MAERERFSTGVNLDEGVRDQMTDLLNTHLAGTFDLYSQTKQAHWNVKGAQFFQLHQLFDELAEDVFKYVDTLAERVTALGGTAEGTVRMASSSSGLDEFPAGGCDGLDCVCLLADRYAKCAAWTREAIDKCTQAGDQGSADIFIEMVRDLDKALWFLEAHLQQAGAARGARPRAA